MTFAHHHSGTAYLMAEDPEVCRPRSGTRARELQASAALDVTWVIPGQHGTPCEAMARVVELCADFPDLFTALWTISATHQGLPKKILAMAVLQCRNDVSDLGELGLEALMTAIADEGRRGFDALLLAQRAARR